MRGVVRQVFRDHYPGYRRSHRLSWRERWAAYNIQTCRTAAQGFHIEECAGGDYKRLRYNSCHHRSCPLCGWAETEAWVQARQAEALACRYFHVIFTLSDELHGLWTYNRRLFSNLLFQSGWHSLRELLSDAKWLGGLCGAIGIFQSWGETLNTHPHLHFIVTAGGLDSSGQWIKAKEQFLLPSRVLRDKFRGKFLAYLKAAVQTEAWVLAPEQSRRQVLNLLNKLGRSKWNVRIEPPCDYADGIIKYLAFYLRRGPISERRIRRYAQGKVSLAYKRPDQHKERTFDLSAEEFIARILTHVPPKGLRMVRAYGLFHHHCRERLNQARAQLAQAPLMPPASSPRTAADSAPRFRAPSSAGRCPKCGRPLVVTFVYYPARDSPERMAA